MSAQELDDDPTDAWWYHQDELIRRYYEEFDMAKVSEMIQSKYLKKEDFPAPAVLTIRDCALEEVGKGQTKWILTFKERTKGVVLNVTKIKQLEGAFGDDSDNWAGKKIKIYHDPNVMMGTERVGGIAFQMPSGAVQAPPPPPAEDFDDGIPF